MEDRPHYERIGRLIYGMQRYGGTEYLLSLREDSAIAPALAERGSVLAGRYDALMRRVTNEGGALALAEVDELLRETGELVAGLAKRD
jgi:hypothetical protein